jgi:hypothetical protein
MITSQALVFHTLSLFLTAAVSSCQPGVHKLVNWSIREIQGMDKAQIAC